jgi:hypothetical protein
MVIAGVLMVSALAVLVVLLGRQAAGKPTGIERGALAVLAVGLFLTGGGLLAKDLLADKSSPSEKPKDQASNTPPAELSRPSDPTSKDERLYLTSMHNSTVEVFIARPGFGMRRMMLPVQDLVTAPKSSSEPPKKDRYGFDVGLPKGTEKQRDVHYAVQDLADGGRVNGMPFFGTWEWKLKKVQLVGLVKHTNPVAYETDKVPGMKDVKDVPSRALTEFEKRSLETLRGGEALAIEKRGNEMRMLGPIFAGTRCTTCHDQKGQMLGAFSYSFEKRSAEELKKLSKQ